MLYLRWFYLLFFSSVTVCSSVRSGLLCDDFLAEGLAIATAVVTMGNVIQWFPYIIMFADSVSSSIYDKSALQSGMGKPQKHEFKKIK